MKKRIAVIVIVFLVAAGGFLLIQWRGFSEPAAKQENAKVFSSSKAIIIPGWMQAVDHYKIYNGLDIWKDNIDPKEKIGSEYVIAHSLGVNFALINWQYNKNTKLILVNPVVPERNFGTAVGDWAATMGNEGFNPKEVVGGQYLASATGKAFKYSQIDPLEIMRKVPRNNLTVFCGSGDKFFCNSDSVKIMVENGINAIEIEGAGHDWSQKFDDEIEKIINKE